MTFGQGTQNTGGFGMSQQPNTQQQPAFGSGFGALGTQNANPQSTFPGASGLSQPAGGLGGGGSVFG